MSKSNLCVIGLSKQFTDEICKQLSIKLEMFYANVQEIIEFELMDLDRVEELCGIDFLNKEEKSITRRICSYENTIVNINYSKLNNDSILEIVKNNCLILYLRLDTERYRIQQDNEDNYYEKIINQEVFADRDFICKNVADITIECLKLDYGDIINKICEKIVDYYS